MSSFLRLPLLLLLFSILQSSSFQVQRSAAQRRNLQRHMTFSTSDQFDSFPQQEEEEDEDRLTDEELMATLSDWDPTVPQMNTVHLTGRIGNDPQPKYFEDGKVVVNLSLANTRKYHYLERQQLNLQRGEEETDWYGLEIWGQTAEFVSKFVDKGMRVGVIGSLQENRWTDKATGEPRNTWKIVVRDFDILESRAESEARRGGSGRRTGGSFSSGSRDDYGSGEDGPTSAGTGGFFDS